MEQKMCVYIFKVTLICFEKSKGIKKLGLEYPRHEKKMFIVYFFFFLNVVIFKLLVPNTNSHYIKK